MRDHLGYDTCPHARLTLSFLGMDDLIIESSFDSQSTLVIDVLGLFVDMLSMGVCPTGTDFHGDIGHTY